MIAIIRHLPYRYPHNYNIKNCFIKGWQLTMMSTSRFFLTVVLVSSAAAVSYYPPHTIGLRGRNLMMKDQLKAQQDGGKADDGLAVAYLPAYVIPDGSPVDPCVTCRPRRTTHNCRRNTGDGCPGRSSPTCTTKSCSSTQSLTAGSKKRFSNSTSNPRPAVASSLSSTAGYTTKSINYSSNPIVKSNRQRT